MSTRKIITLVEETITEGGRPVEPAARGGGANRLASLHARTDRRDRRGGRDPVGLCLRVDGDERGSFNGLLAGQIRECHASNLSAAIPTPVSATAKTMRPFSGRRRRPGTFRNRRAVLRSSSSARRATFRCRRISTATAKPTSRSSARRTVRGGICVHQTANSEYSDSDWN